MNTVYFAHEVTGSVVGTQECLARWLEGLGLKNVKAGMYGLTVSLETSDLQQKHYYTVVI
jgi:predicted DNA-binding protein (UPF0278 family)